MPVAQANIEVDGHGAMLVGSGLGYKPMMHDETIISGVLVK